LNQQDNSQFALYYPSNGQQENNSVVISVYSIDGMCLLKEQIIRKGEKIYLGKNWSPNQYLIYCKYPLGNHETFKWIKW